MRIVRVADYRTVPWKNGGGLTREIAAWPPDAGFDDFVWRISMARVDAAGPFSVFAGIDRTLTVLEGGTMRLGDVELTPDSEPFAFSGDEAIDARVEGGPILDLNVMTRRGRAIHTVARRTFAGAETLYARTTLTLLFPLATGLVADGHGLGARDALCLYADDPPAALDATGGVQALIVGVTLV